MDGEFRKDIKRLCSKAEQDFVQALIRFHNRNIEGLHTAIRQEKRVKANKKKQKSNVTKTTAFMRSAPKETVNENNVTRVSKRINELKAEIMSLSTILDVNNKQKRDYTCLLSDSRNIKRGLGKINLSQTQNKKQKERRTNDRKDRFHAQTEANKKHIKDLSNIALIESYLEIQLTKPKDNLLNTEGKTLKTLRENPNINLKKADKGTRMVVLNTVDKIREGQIQIDNPEHYKPLEHLMVVETSLRVQQLVEELHEQNYINDMTNKWFCQTPNPPRTPVFYTLTKIHKPTPVGRPIISGCDGPTERFSAFVDKLLQPIAKEQES